MMQRWAQQYNWLGPLLWITSLQYFIAQVIVALRFIPTYSWRDNTISDLGNTMCGSYGGRGVCSPWHTSFNVSLIILGLTMAAGALLITYQFRRSRLAQIGFGCLILAGIGTTLVGLFPENTVSFVHAFGATLPFLIGNIGLILIGFAVPMPRWLQIYTIASGAIMLLALVFFASSHFGGLGIGGVERIVAYPQTVWLIIFGGYCLRLVRR